MEKQNKNLKIVIALLTVILLALGSYIAYTNIFKNIDDKCVTHIDSKYTKITDYFYDNIHITEVIDNKDNTYTIRGERYDLYKIPYIKMEQAKEKNKITLDDGVTYTIKTKEDDYDHYYLYNNTETEYIIDVSTQDSILTRAAQIKEIYKRSNQYYEFIISSDAIINIISDNDDKENANEYFKDYKVSKQINLPKKLSSYPKYLYKEFTFKNGICTNLYRQSTTL